MTMMLISAGVQAGTGAYRNIKAQRGLNMLERQRLPSYMDAAGPLQQNYTMAARQARMGLSPEAAALARSTAASQSAGQFRAASELSGGQLGSALGRIGAMNTTQLGLQMGVQDQMARERGTQQMMGINRELSGLQQRDIGVGLQRRSEAERGYGQAIQDSRREMIGAASGLATGYLGYQNAEANRQLTRDMYGIGGSGNGGGGAANVVTPSTFLTQAPGTFPTGRVGPQTFDNYLLSGAPRGTTQTYNTSLSPDFGTNQNQIMETPFKAYNPNALNQFLTPAMASQVSGRQLMPNAPLPNPNMMNNAMMSPRGGITYAAPDYQQPAFGSQDMSGDAYYQQFNNPNFLKFRNPYRMNRGMQYDAVRGNDSFGQTNFQLR